jgi:hypothetical protein
VLGKVSSFGIIQNEVNDALVLLYREFLVGGDESDGVLRFSQSLFNYCSKVCDFTLITSCLSCLCVASGYLQVATSAGCFFLSFLVILFESEE